MEYAETLLINRTYEHYKFLTVEEFSQNRNYSILDKAVHNSIEHETKNFKNKTLSSDNFWSRRTKKPNRYRK
jgi:hypothetical protein